MANLIKSSLGGHQIGHGIHQGFLTRKWDSVSDRLKRKFFVKTMTWIGNQVVDIKTATTFILSFIWENCEVNAGNKNRGMTIAVVKGRTWPPPTVWLLPYLLTYHFKWYTVFSSILELRIVLFLLLKYGILYWLCVLVYSIICVYLI